MSNSETTAAVQRGAIAAEKAVMGYTRPDGTYVQGAVNFWDDCVESGELISRDVLAAALDVEEMARATYEEGAWCGVCELAGWDACAECRETVRGYARALRAAILGGAE